MARATHILYDDGTMVELQPESEEIKMRICQVMAPWVVSVSRKDVEGLLMFSPMWKELSCKMAEFWAQLDGPKLPPSLVECQKMGIRSCNLYRRQ